MFLFKNQMHAADGWLTQCDGCTPPSGSSWDTEEQSQLVRDSNGWVISFGTNPARQFTHIALSLFAGASEYAPAGDWTILYDGEGTLEYGFAPFVTVVSQSPGRDVIRITPQADSLLRVRLSNINPANHVRNIRILLPGGTCGPDPFSYAPSAASCPGNFLSFEQTYQAQRYHPLFLAEMRIYRAIRFMQFQGTVEDINPSSWSARSLLTDAIWKKGWADGSPPHELMYELSNVLGADPWVNMPFWADDNYIQQAAALALQQLDPSLNIYVEYSNEVWNTAYPYSVYGNQIEAWAETRWPNATFPDGSPASGFTKRLNWFGMRTAQTCAIWKQVWGPNANRVRCVMAGGPWSYPAEEAMACPFYAAENGGNNCAGQISAIATGPYFGGYLSDRTNADGGHFEQLLSWAQQTDGGMNSIFQELNTGQLLQQTGYTSGAINGIRSIMSDNYQVAQRYGVDLVAYEGGQHLTPVSALGITCSQYNNDPSCPNYRLVQNLFINANRDARIASLYSTYLSEWRNQGGKLFMHYHAYGIPSGQYGSWGAKDYVGQPETQTPKFRAIRSFIQQNPCWWSGCEL